MYSVILADCSTIFKCQTLLKNTSALWGTSFVLCHYFVLIQVDNEYRIAWDQFVLKLDVVDSDPLSGSEVLHWVTKFPVSRALKSTFRHELLFLVTTLNIWFVLLYLRSLLKISRLPAQRAASSGGLAVSF